MLTPGTECTREQGEESCLYTAQTRGRFGVCEGGAINTATQQARVSVAEPRRATGAVANEAGFIQKLAGFAPFHQCLLHILHEPYYASDYTDDSLAH